MAGGQIIVDRVGKIWLRFDEVSVISQYTALCNWDDMLILGRGSASRPDLCYADWDTVTEEGAISGNTSQPDTIKSVWRTKSLDFGLPDVEKQIRSVEVIYQDHPDWSGETITVKYCINHAGTDNVPTFTSLGTITLGTATCDYETKHATLTFTGLSNTGKFFEFQFEAEDHIRINKMIVYYDVLSKTYD